MKSEGPAPSSSPVKLCSVVNTPAAVSLKTVPCWFVLLLIACSPVPTSHAQQLERQAREAEKKYLSYGFVSPNTREDLKLHEAIKELNSAEEIRLMNEIRMIGCQRDRQTELRPAAPEREDRHVDAKTAAAWSRGVKAPADVW